MATSLPVKVAAPFYEGLHILIKKMEKIFLAYYNREIKPLIISFQKEVEKYAKEIERLENETITTNSRRYINSLSLSLKALLRRTQGDIAEKLNVINRELDLIFTPARMRRLSIDLVNGTSVFQREELISEIASKMPKRYRNSINAIVPSENNGIHKILVQEVPQTVNLIKTIPSDYFKGIEDAVMTGLENGDRATAIAQEIKAQTGVTDARARFIARDQLANLYGKIVKERAMGLGVEKFKWITSKDRRVRATHKELEGEVFEYSTGVQGSFDDTVIGLIPGEDYNCRCVASSVMDDEWINKRLQQLEAMVDPDF